MSDTVEVIKQIVVEIKRSPGLLATLRPETSLIDDVGLDSLELLQFMLEIEGRLALRIDFEALDFADLHSISRLAAFMDSMPALQASDGCTITPS